jgi:hypothetical protein
MLQQRPSSSISDIVSDHRLRRAFDEAILYRITLRRWYREHRLTYNWPDLEHENTAILRAMLHIRRDAKRRLPQPLDRWTETELREAWGK